MRHLDDRDTDRVRTRAYFLSRGHSRKSAADHLRNWFDAENEEERILLSVLDNFPCLYGVFTSLPEPPSLSVCYIGDLLRTIRDEGFDYYGLTDVENMADILISRFGATALYEQLNDFFVDSDAALSKARWFKAVTEISALSHLHNLGALASLGWPPPSAGSSNTPPFDCRIKSSGGAIPCDVKPASGSGFKLVRDKLGPVIQNWSLTNNLSGIDFFIRYRGSVAQQLLGPVLRQTTSVQQFESTLNRHTIPPAVPIQSTIGGTHFDIIVTGSGSSNVSSGFQPASALIKAMLPTLVKHVKKKGGSAAAAGHTPFLLCYVRLSGIGGGDLKPAHLYHDWFRAASVKGADLGAGNSLWLGVLLLDYVTGTPRSICYLRSAGSWPPGVTPTNLATALSSQLKLI